MKFSHSRFLALPLAIALLPLVAGCIAFRPDSYDATLAFKTRTLAVMADATVPATERTADITVLRQGLEQRLADERARPGNEQIVAMWTIMADPQRDLLAGYLRMWETRGTLPPALITAKRDQVGRAFDKILVLEKSKPQ